MTHYSIELRTRKYIKWYGFLSFARNPSNKYGKNILAIGRKTGINAAKPASKKVCHKAAETTGELIENKIAVPDENSRNVE